MADGKWRLTAITVSDEFAQGYDAWAIREEPKDNNPYDPRTKEAIRWNAGWYAAKTEDIAEQRQWPPL